MATASMPLWCSCGGAEERIPDNGGRCTGRRTSDAALCCGLLTVLGRCGMLHRRCGPFWMVIRLLHARHRVTSPATPCTAGCGDRVSHTATHHACATAFWPSSPTPQPLGGSMGGLHAVGWDAPVERLSVPARRCRMHTGRQLLVQVVAIVHLPRLWCWRPAISAGVVGRLCGLPHRMHPASAGC